MFTLSAFADEVSSDFTEQMDILEAEGVKHIEMRGILGKNVIELTDDEAKSVKKMMDDRGFALSAVGSPIGKIKISDDFDEHLDKFKRTVELAEALDAPYIRLFSYFIPEDDDPAKYRDEVMRRMRAKVDAAKDSKVILLHENERHIYGDTGPRCKDILDEMAAPNLKGIVDPANYVICGEDPFDCWSSMKDETIYLHVKDATKDGEITPAGLGDGRFGDIFKELVGRSFNGFASLEPHLSAAHASRGETAPDLFKWASDSLKKVIDEAGGEWN